MSGSFQPAPALAPMLAGLYPVCSGVALSVRPRLKMSSQPTQKRSNLPALVVALFALVAISLPAQASALTLPAPEFSPPNTNPIVKLARAELAKKVVERRGDNVPRYRNGRGRVAPYSIGDQWCVAFTTWVWKENGFDDYLGTTFLRRSRDRSTVAIQVKDMTRWARRDGYFSFRAMPGFAVVYGGRHMGIVRKVDRDGRAVLSIEGNKSNRVRSVKVPMDEVTGYISPFPIFPAQAVPRTSKFADVD